MFLIQEFLLRKVFVLVEKFKIRIDNQNLIVLYSVVKFVDFIGPSMGTTVDLC